MQQGTTRKSNRSLRSLFWLLLPFLCLSLTGDINKRDGFTIAGGAAAPTYLVEEDADSDPGASWTAIGSGGTWNDTSSISTGALSVDDTDGEYTDYTANSEVWAYAIVEVDTSLSGNPYILPLRNGGTQVAAIRIISDGDIRAYGGTNSGNVTAGIGSLSAGTEYHFWIHYTTTGSASTTDVYVNTSATRPGSADISHSGTSTLDASRLYLDPNGSATVHYENIRVDDAEIGSSPP